MNQEVQKIVVRLGDCDAGWISMDVSAGAQTVDILCDDFFCPFRDLLRWLEAITLGVQECSFWIGDEGAHIRVEFRRFNYNKFILTLSNSPVHVHESRKDPETNDRGEILMIAFIEPKQLVSEFYHAIRNFAKSPEYVPSEWEFESLGDRLINVFDEKYSEIGNMIEALSEFSSTELKKLFFYAAPSYAVSFEGVTDKKEEMHKFIDMVRNPSSKEANKGKIETPSEWHIDKGYDLWDKDKKTEYLCKYMKEHVNSWAGMKLKEFKSEIVEKYIGML